jgi:hypothetical protein
MVKHCPTAIPDDKCDGFTTDFLHSLDYMKNCPSEQLKWLAIQQLGFLYKKGIVSKVPSPFPIHEPENNGVAFHCTAQTRLERCNPYHNTRTQEFPIRILCALAFWIPLALTNRCHEHANDITKACEYNAYTAAHLIHTVAMLNVSLQTILNTEFVHVCRSTSISNSICLIPTVR